MCIYIYMYIYIIYIYTYIYIFIYNHIYIKLNNQTSGDSCGNISTCPNWHVQYYSKLGHFY